MVFCRWKRDFEFLKIWKDAENYAIILKKENSPNLIKFILLFRGTERFLTFFYFFQYTQYNNVVK